MPILEPDDSLRTESSPGVGRSRVVDGELGADSLTVADLTLSPASKVPTHIHPTEEAMVILDGELEAMLGDETVTVAPGQTVLAPAGVKHGFVNRTGSNARLMAIFPTDQVERTFVAYGLVFGPFRLHCESLAFVP